MSSWSRTRPRSAVTDRLLPAVVSLSPAPKRDADLWAWFDPQGVRAELESRRADWAVSLDQLAQYVDSLEAELIKTAGSVRRSRTEILHLSNR